MKNFKEFINENKDSVSEWYKYNSVTEYIIDSSQISENVIQFKLTEVNDSIIDHFKNEYPNKWVLYNKKFNYIFVKDKPGPFIGRLPDKVYHVSGKDDLDSVGIQTSTKLESPFGYIDISFFYLSVEDSEDGSIPYIEGESYLYEVDTNATDKWLEGFNEPLDGEENISTAEFIEPQYIKKIK